MLAGAGSIFLASKKGKPCVVTKNDLKAVYNSKCGPKKTCINNSLFKNTKGKMLVYRAGAGAAWSRFFLPGAGADPIWSEPEAARGPRTSGAGAAQKVAAPQHCLYSLFRTLSMWRYLYAGFSKIRIVFFYTEPGRIFSKIDHVTV